MCQCTVEDQTIDHALLRCASTEGGTTGSQKTQTWTSGHFCALLKAQVAEETGHSLGRREEQESRGSRGSGGGGGGRVGSGKIEAVMLFLCVTR